MFVIKIEKINSDLDNREKNVSNREIELDSLSKEREDLFNGKIKELEDEYAVLGRPCHDVASHPFLV